MRVCVLRCVYLDRPVVIGAVGGIPVGAHIAGSGSAQSTGLARSAAGIEAVEPRVGKVRVRYHERTPSVDHGVPGLEGRYRPNVA